MKNLKIKPYFAIIILLTIMLTGCGGKNSDTVNPQGNTESTGSEISQTQTQTQTESNSTVVSTVSGFTDTEIADLKQDYVAADCNSENGPCYMLTVNSVSKDEAKIDIGYIGYNCSPVYNAPGITVPLKFENAEKTVLCGDFKWTDSWGNSGTGKLKFTKTSSGKPDVVLNMKMEKETESGVNRATLDTNGDKIFIIKT